MIKLKPYQEEAIENLKNGSILCGGVGSGKSITALAYYLFKVCGGSIKVEGTEQWFEPMKTPRDLYIITTAKKRDSLEWDKECANFCLCADHEANGNAYGVKVVIDSWNNIKKYKDVFGAFFIFDEQRVVGSGTWVKTFLNIARKNQWILLSATPGDTWSDYIPVFVANGFYKNKTEFNTMHCVFSRFSKYPKIERYVGTKLLEHYRDEVLVKMEDNRSTVRHNIDVKVGYDKEKYKRIWRERWNPYDNCPIEETGKLLYLMRRVVNEDPERIEKLETIYLEHNKLIVFYNFNYELEILRRWCEWSGILYAEWNGQKHEAVPEGRKWVYLVQYSAGSEGWNCISTNATVFYSQTYSYRSLEQASGRIDRINTPYHNLYYFHIRSNAPIDVAIHAALSGKKNFNERAFLKDGGDKE